MKKRQSLLTILLICLGLLTVGCGDTVPQEEYISPHFCKKNPEIMINRIKRLRQLGRIKEAEELAGRLCMKPITAKVGEPSCESYAKIKNQCSSCRYVWDATVKEDNKLNKKPNGDYYAYGGWTGYSEPDGTTHIHTFALWTTHGLRYFDRSLKPAAKKNEADREVRFHVYKIYLEFFKKTNHTFRLNGKAPRLDTVADVGLITNITFKVDENTRIDKEIFTNLKHLRRLRMISFQGGPKAKKLDIDFSFIKKWPYAEMMMIFNDYPVDTDDVCVMFSGNCEHWLSAKFTNTNIDDLAIKYINDSKFDSILELHNNKHLTPSGLLYFTKRFSHFKHPEYGVLKQPCMLRVDGRLLTSENEAYLDHVFNGLVSYSSSKLVLTERQKLVNFIKANRSGVGFTYLHDNKKRRGSKKPGDAVWLTVDKLDSIVSISFSENVGNALTNDVLKSLRHLKNLNSISFSGRAWYQRADKGRVLKDLFSIDHLDFNSLDMTNITSLSFFNVSIDDKDMAKIIKNKKKLAYLSINHCDNISIEMHDKLCSVVDFVRYYYRGGRTLQGALDCRGPANFAKSRKK